MVARFRERVVAALGDTVERIVLFGSRARGRPRPRGWLGAFQLRTKADRLRRRNLTEAGDRPRDQAGLPKARGYGNTPGLSAARFSTRC